MKFFPKESNQPYPCHLKNMMSLWFRDKILRKKNLEDNGAKRNLKCTFVETKKQY